MRLTPQALRRQRQFGGTVGRILLPIVIGIVAVALQQYWAVPLLAGIGVTSAAVVSGIAFAVGAAIGSLIAYAAFPVKQGFTGETSKPGEFAIPQSQEGIPIPFLAGMIKASGIFLWTTNFRSVEVKGQAANAGKGGGGGGGDPIIGYNYFVTFAYAICLGKVDVLKSIYADEKLIYGGSSSDTLIPSGSILEGRTYFNKGPASIVYDGNTVSNGGSFIGVTGVTTYTISGMSDVGIVARAHLPRRIETTGPSTPLEGYQRMNFDRKYMVFVSGTKTIQYPPGIGAYTHRQTFTTGSLGTLTQYYSQSVAGSGWATVLEDTPSGSLEVGKKYMVLADTGGTLNITHNGISYSDGDWFVAASSSYTITLGSGIVVVDRPSNVTTYDEYLFINLGYDGVKKVTYRGTIYADGEAFLGKAGRVVYEVDAIPSALVVAGGEVLRAGAATYSDFTIEEASCRIYWGDIDQPAPDSTFLPAPFVPNPNLKYGGVCYILFKDFPLKMFTHVPRISVELGRTSGVFSEVAAISGSPDFSALNTSTTDVNPVVALYEVLTSSKMGVQFTSADIDGDSFLSAAQTLESEGILLSIYLYSGTTFRSFMTELTKYIECVFYFTGSKLAIRLLRNDYQTTIASGSIVSGKTYTVYGSGFITYNGLVYSNGQSFLGISGITTYTSNGSVKVLPIFSMNYEKIFGSIQVARQTLGQLATEISFTCINRGNQYKPIVQTKRFNAIFEESENPAPENIEYPWVVDSTTLGLIISRTLKRKGQSLAAVGFTASSELYGIEPGDILYLYNLSFLPVGSQELFLRVGKVAVNTNETISVECMEDPYGTFSPSTESPVIDHSNPPASSTPVPFGDNFFGVELPYEIVATSGEATDNNEPVVLVFAARTDDAQISYQIQAAENYGAYQIYGISGFFALKGVLDQGYGVTTEFDSSGTLQVDFTGMLADDIARLSELSALEFSDAFQGRFVLVIGSEYLFVISATDLGSNIWSFHVLRNRCGTIRTPHETGADVFFIPAVLSVRPGKPVGDLDPNDFLEYKALSGSVSELESPSAVVAKSLGVGGVAAQGIVAENIMVDGDLSTPTYDTSSATYITVSWTPRFRNQGSGFASNAISSMLYPINFPDFPECEFQIEIIIGNTTSRVITKTPSPNGSVVESVTQGKYYFSDLFSDNGGSYPDRFQIVVRSVSLQPGYEGILGVESFELSVFRLPTVFA